MLGIVRIALAVVAVLAFAMFQSDGCGYEPDPLKGEGEPCTRSSECQSGLSCRGGVCLPPPTDFDAGEPPTFDAGRDAGDADAGDADAGDAGDRDAGDLDAGGLPDAGEPDAGDLDAGSDAG